MKVIAVEVFGNGSGTRRGRVCQRRDGRFQFVTEMLTAATDELLPYWLNEHPPSGVYERQEDATEALLAALGSAESIGRAEPFEFDINVGPYPEPTLSHSQ